MSRSLILSALRAVEKTTAFRPGNELLRFLQENNIGNLDRSMVTLDRKDRSEIRELLLAQFNIPMSARSDSWEDLSRHEALALGSNEKLAPLNVRKSIVAVKAFPGRPICLTTGKINLPLGANIMISHNDLHITDAHSSIVLIENWEAFERIHHLSFPVPVHLESALLIYRGDVGVLPTEATHDWLRSHNVPVYVFSDQDPSGLVIAMTAPNFTGLMFPPHADLKEAFSAGKGDRKRYLDQIVSCNDLLSTCENAEISSYFNIIRDAGRALPQEEFVRSKS